MIIFDIIGVGVVLYAISFLILLCFVNCDLRLAFYEKLGRSLGRMRGNVVFIVGASSGIGEHTAIILAKNGVKLVLAARRLNELERVKALCLNSSEGKLTTNDILVIQMDILDIYSHKKYFDQALRHFGHIDILFNNVGRGQRAVFEIIEASVDKQIFDLNVFSTVHLSRVAVNYFINRGVGHIAVTSSLASIMGGPFASSATASKAALNVSTNENTIIFKTISKRFFLYFLFNVILIVIHNRYFFRILDSSEGKLTTNDILVIQMDILDIYSHKKYFDQALRHFGHIDILFNNVGRGQRAVFEIIEASVDKQIFDLNVFSTVHLSRVAVNYFINRGVGHIAVTSSLASIMGGPFASSATASKAALNGYFRSLRAEMVGKNVAVSLICPGPVSTNYEEKSFTDRAGEVYGVQATGKMMGTERCGKLCAVTFANRLDEVWISKFHHLFMSYMAVYFPLVYNVVLNLIGPDKMFKTYAPIEVTNNVNRPRNK
ncbi:dehydrogenase/reductase SDR family member 7 [Agrilus planipennis]|uniref:Dehydrogenase/reductase SDR family member 7 n=1 Tax=Agrilus planipennis TaxID=224129 RepID=A0A7F5RLV5_AGRPL|nr:dehydrogenase/reductase SDR family member 7 [Agrilus planipennis]